MGGCGTALALAPMAAAGDGAAGRGADGVLGGEKRKRLGEDGEHR